MNFTKILQSILYLCTLLLPPASIASPLNGKKVVFIGNSFIYYGGCVNKGKQGQTDKGLFHALCRAGGDRVKVYDCTYGGHRLHDFTEKGCTSASLHTKPSTSGCAGIGTDLLKKIKTDDIDIVFLSEAGEDNKHFLRDIHAVMARFPNPKTRFFYLCHTYTHFRNHRHILDQLATLEKEGVTVVDWGGLAYGLVQGTCAVSSSPFRYTQQTFIKNKGDRHHPNLLSGYLTALMAYCAASGAEAQGQPYDIVERLFDTDAFIRRHYQHPTDTNFKEILLSPSEMQGLQALADSLLHAPTPWQSSGAESPILTKNKH